MIYSASTFKKTICQLLISKMNLDTYNIQIIYPGESLSLSFCAVFNNIELTCHITTIYLLPLKAFFDCIVVLRLDGSFSQLIIYQITFCRCWSIGLAGVCCRSCMSSVRDLLFFSDIFPNPSPPSPYQPPHNSTPLHLITTIPCYQ